MTTLRLQLDPRSIAVVPDPVDQNNRRDEQHNMSNIQVNPVQTPSLHRSKNVFQAVDLHSISPYVREGYEATDLAEKLEGLNVTERKQVDKSQHTALSIGLETPVDALNAVCSTKGVNVEEDSYMTRTPKRFSKQIRRRSGYGDLKREVSRLATKDKKGLNRGIYKNERRTREKNRIVPTIYADGNIFNREHMQLFEDALGEFPIPDTSSKGTIFSNYSKAFALMEAQKRKLSYETGIGIVEHSTSTWKAQQEQWTKVFLQQVQQEHIHSVKQTNCQHSAGIVLGSAWQNRTGERKTPWEEKLSLNKFSGPNERLSAEIHKCILHIKSTEQEFAACQNTVIAIHDALQSSFPNCNVKYTGSWWTNLSLPTSPVDLVIYLNNPNTSDVESHLQSSTLTSLLRNYPPREFNIPKKKPFEHVSELSETFIIYALDMTTGKDVRIFLEDTKQQELDELSRYWLARYPEDFQLLVLLIKHFLVMTESHPRNGGISGFAVQCMITGFFDLTQHRDAAITGSEKSVDYYPELLMNFLQFYAHPQRSSVKTFKLNSDSLMFRKEHMRWELYPRLEGDQKSSVLAIHHPLQDNDSLYVNTVAPLVSNVTYGSTIRMFKDFGVVYDHYIATDRRGGLEELLGGFWDNWEKARTEKVKLYETIVNDNESMMEF